MGQPLDVHHTKFMSTSPRLAVSGSVSYGLCPSGNAIVSTVQMIGPVFDHYCGLGLSFSASFHGGALKGRLSPPFPGRSRSGREESCSGSNSLAARKGSLEEALALTDWC